MRRFSVALGAVLFLALAGGIAEHYHVRTLDTAHAELAAARAEAQIALDSAKTQTARIRAVQDSAAAQRNAARAAESRAAAAEAVATNYRAKYESLRASAPDTCTPIILAADAALEAADSVSAAYRDAVHFSAAAAEGYARGLLAAQGTIVGLVGVQHRLDHAAAQAVAQGQPSLISRLTPHLGIGFAAGVDALGQPHLITGITLGWGI